MSGPAPATEAELCTAYAAAAAALLAPPPPPPPVTPPGPSADEARQRAAQLAAAAACLDEQVTASDSELKQHTVRQAVLHRQLEEQCSEAGRQHEGIAAALATVASRLSCLSVTGGASQAPPAAAPQHGASQRPTTQQPPAPLLGLDLPDSYASACRNLLDNLSGYLTHHFNHLNLNAAAHAQPSAGAGRSAGGGGGSGADGLAAAQLHQAAARELEQLQGGLVQAERLRVEEEAELARLQAELEVLRAPSATAAAASLGYSAADLEAEVASLRRRRGAFLAAAVDAAGAAAAAGAGAEAVEEQVALRRGALEQRVIAKQQVAAVLARHLARQLVVRQLLQVEQAALQEVQATVSAARQDAELALQAVQERLPCYTSPGPEEQHDQQQQQAPAAAAAGRGVSQPAAGAAQEQQPGQAGDPMATAQQLLACRARLQQLLEQLHAAALPAHRTVFAQLHGLLYPGSTNDSGEAGGEAGGQAGGSTEEAAAPELELSPAALREQLAEVQAAHRALALQAAAVLEEVMGRQVAPGDRQLAEVVLHKFWGEPGQLPVLAEKQRRQLATYGAA